MKIPTLEEAKKLIDEAGSMNPGLWVEHSRVTAHCAERIAGGCEGMDREAAYILGLLHDVGRRFGESHFGHVVFGYRYMKNLGYEDVARICLTHSFQHQNINAYIGKFDVPEEEKRDAERLLLSITYDDYDRLIQLCDGLAMAEGVALMEKRLIDVVMRYGFNEYTTLKWKAIFDLKTYFENKTGRNIYELITDDRSLWGK